MKTIELKKVARQIQRGTYAAVDFESYWEVWSLIEVITVIDHYGIDNGDYGDR